MDLQQTEKSQKLALIAEKNLGKVLSDGNAELGCAITVNNLAIKAWGKAIGGGASTNLMFKSLQDKKRFREVFLSEALPGDILISPTGYSRNPNEHGHVGVVEMYAIYSNNSKTGKVDSHWTIPAWVDNYLVKKGFPVKLYRAL